MPRTLLIEAVDTLFRRRHATGSMGGPRGKNVAYHVSRYIPGWGAICNALIALLVIDTITIR